MTKLNELAAFVCGASVESLPGADRERQKRHFIDTIVAAVAGLRCRETIELKALFGAGLDERMAHLAAAIRMTEIDDIHMPSCTTPSAVSVPVACAMALAGKTSAATVADAIWVGTELLARLGMAVDGPSTLYREVWPTYLGAPLAAAAAARMLGLNEAKTVSALSIALTLTAGGSGRFRQDLSPRWFLHGMGVRSGYLAAKAAEAGYVGDAELLDRDWLSHSHGVALDLNRLFEGLGNGRSIYRELSMKLFFIGEAGGCRYRGVAIDRCRRVCAGVNSLCHRACAESLCRHDRHPRGSQQPRDDVRERALSNGASFIPSGFAVRRRSRQAAVG